MKKVLLSFLLITLLSLTAFSQERPFARFTEAVETERAGFSGNKEKLSTVFDIERARIGQNFESELLKYLGSDPEKHYWIALFLTSHSYLHGSPPMPDLALDIFDKGLKLTKNAKDDKNIGLRYKLSIAAAVLAQKIGQNVIALEYRSLGGRIIASGFDTSIYEPALNNYDRCIYKNIGGYVEYCKPGAEDPPPPKMIAKGHVATPNGGDPGDYRERVKVRVETDEQGNVLKATPIEGAPAYHDRAITLAKEVTLKPTHVSGKLLPMIAILTYYFK